ncbi:MAG: NB-ARC domain-containing protein [Coleofasciculaceae cyanobacterium]
MSIKASTAGLAKIKQARKDKGWNVDDPRWLEEASAVLEINWETTGYLAEGISEGTWKRFLAGKRPIKAEAFKVYSQILGLNWQEISTKDSVQNWGEAPESGIFYGRTNELTTLEKWLLNDKCRLVTLLGMGGIGKTALVIKFAESNQEQFEAIIWKSLRYIPTLEDFLGQLILAVSNQQVSDLATGISARLIQLIDCLRKRRCLLVLDDFESVLWNGDFQEEIARLNPTINYRVGYEEYGEFIKRIGESQHQSAIVLISREKPKEIAAIEGKSPIRSLQLSGLQTIDAVEILKNKGLSGEERWETLTSLYRGNPLALNVVSATIQDLFNNSVQDFLNQNTLVITGFTDILEQQFNRLSKLEKQVAYWLAIHYQPVSLSQLQNDIGLVKKSQLIDALQSLSWRSLIEKATGDVEVIFTLPPVVMKYVYNKFIEQVCEEIFEQNLELVKSHAFVNPEKDNFKEFKLKPILTAITEHLTTAFRNDKHLRKHLSQILSILEGKPALEIGYAEKNILKLLAELDSGL